MDDNVDRRGRRSRSDVIAELFAEFLREAAVLVGVFAPLDAVIQRRPLTALNIWTTVVLVGALLGLGIYIEVKRR